MEASRASPPGLTQAGSCTECRLPGRRASTVLRPHGGLRDDGAVIARFVQTIWSSARGESSNPSWSHCDSPADRPSRRRDRVRCDCPPLRRRATRRISECQRHPGRLAVEAPNRAQPHPLLRGCSLLRMFIALALSTIFTFVYGTAAARLRRAEKLLIPAPRHPSVGAHPGFPHLHHRVLPEPVPGERAAGWRQRAIFAVFTSQAWNMTFSFYHSLITQPRDLDEAARMYRLTKWQRFWKLDVPRLDDRPGLERHDVDGRWLVLPDRLRGDHGQRSPVRPAGDGQLHRRGHRRGLDRQGRDRRGRDGHPGGRV